MPIIIHTSDIHLGAPLGWLGPRAGEQRDQLRRTLSKIVDVTIDQHADALVVAGDLFHSNNPSAATVRFVLREFARLTEDSRAQVVLLPGSHDALESESVYASYRDEFGRMEKVSVLGLDGVTRVDMKDAGLALFGNPRRPGQSDAHQLAGMRPDTEVQFNVAVLHGSVDVEPVPPEDDPIHMSDLASKGWSYFALGHWHSWRQVEGASVPAIYPGSPEIVALDQGGQGHVARVELRANGTVATKVCVGTRSVVDAKVDVTGVGDALSVVERVRKQALSNPQAVLRLVLTGLMSANTGIDDGDLVEELSQDYFFVCPPVRDYQVKLSDTDLAQLPERLVVGRFARHMRGRLDEAGTEEERQEIEDALQLGVALLQGKEVVE